MKHLESIIKLVLIGAFGFLLGWFTFRSVPARLAVIQQCADGLQECSDGLEKANKAFSAIYSCKTLITPEEAQCWENAGFPK